MLVRPADEPSEVEATATGSAAMAAMGFCAGGNEAEGDGHGHEAAAGKAGAVGDMLSPNCDRRAGPKSAPRIRNRR